MPKSSKNNKVTQATIARAAGTSQAAVSAVLSNSKRLVVSSETQAKVLGLAEKLGYVRPQNRVRVAAQKMERHHVLIVESDQPQAVSYEPWIEAAYQTFMGRIFSVASRRLQEVGSKLSVFHMRERQSLSEWLADSDVDGVLWRANDSDTALLYWVATKFPLVLLNRQWSSSVPFDMVGVDQEKNILLAAEHLWKLGHRRIATFGHFPGNSIFRRRMAAYRQFVGTKGLRNYEEFQRIPDDLEIPALEKVAAMIETWKSLRDEAPTALITADVFALPLLREAQRAGISIPEDLSVIGIDNTSACSLVEPALTSLEEPFEEMSRLAVDLFLRRKADPSVASQVVQIAPRLIKRQSVCRRLADSAGALPSTSVRGSKTLQLQPTTNHEPYEHTKYINE